MPASLRWTKGKQRGTGSHLLSLLARLPTALSLPPANKQGARNVCRSTSTPLMNKESELTGSSAAGTGSDWTHNSGFSLFAVYWGKYVHARLQVLSTRVVKWWKTALHAQSVPCHCFELPLHSDASVHHVGGGVYLLVPAMFVVMWSRFHHNRW